MAKFTWGRVFKEYIRTMWPAFVTLLATLIIATFITEFTFTSGGKAFGSILSRFARLFLNLTFPLLFLPAICALIQHFLNRNPGQLVQVKKEEDTIFHAFQSWVVRPLQGIGLLMLMATHFFRAFGGIFGEFLYRPDNLHNSHNAASGGNYPWALRKFGSNLDTSLFCLDDG